MAFYTFFHSFLWSLRARGREIQKSNNFLRGMNKSAKKGVKNMNSVNKCKVSSPSLSEPGRHKYTPGLICELAQKVPYQWSREFLVAQAMFLIGFCLICGTC